MIKLFIEKYYETIEVECSRINLCLEIEKRIPQFPEPRCVWLVTDGKPGDSEIMVTENITKALYAIESEQWDDISMFFVQQYNCYEDAYAVALQMREPNPLCYDHTNYN